jgi:hypothetical protein
MFILPTITLPTIFRTYIDYNPQGQPADMPSAPVFETLEEAEMAADTAISVIRGTFSGEKSTDASNLFATTQAAALRERCGTHVNLIETVEKFLTQQCENTDTAHAEAAKILLEAFRHAEPL